MLTHKTVTKRLFFLVDLGDLFYSTDENKLQGTERRDNRSDCLFNTDADFGITVICIIFRNKLGHSHI